ncbi:hypothetical protein B0H14DRAFT_2578284 [Mycena olivaceomarginata]|nr:hypothetical protein B0H14DRAFT_2578284 [Mycena olivaceomarginata]
MVDDNEDMVSGGAQNAGGRRWRWRGTEWPKEGKSIVGIGAGAWRQCSAVGRMDQTGFAVFETMLAAATTGAVAAHPRATFRTFVRLGFRGDERNESIGWRRSGPWEGVTGEMGGDLEEVEERKALVLRWFSNSGEEDTDHSDGITLPPSRSVAIFSSSVLFPFTSLRNPTHRGTYSAANCPWQWAFGGDHLLSAVPIGVGGSYRAPGSYGNAQAWSLNGGAKSCTINPREASLL